MNLHNPVFAETGPETESAALRERLFETRTLSSALAAPLSDEDQVVQVMDDASPTKWHLAHITWFFENFVLAHFNPGYARFHEGYAFLFNSYYETVGSFYETLGSKLKAFVIHMGEDAAFSGDPTLQLSPAELALAGARPVICMKTALSAFATIVEQGEGAPEHSADSHYQKFLAIREEYARLKQKNPDFQPAFPSAQGNGPRRPRGARAPHATSVARARALRSHRSRERAGPA